MSLSHKTAARLLDRHRLLLQRRRHPPQRQIDPTAIPEQCRGRWIDAVDAVKAEAAFTAEHDDIAAFQPERLRGAVAAGLADPEQAIVAKRDGIDRRGKIDLVAILMQAHLRVLRV